jgi:hypothetical protein
MTYDPNDPFAKDQPPTSYGNPQVPNYPPPQGYQPAPTYPPPGYGYPPPPGYGPPPYGYYAPPVGTNGFAIAALVLGILWVYWIGSILAIIFALVAKRQIKERNQSGDGMATAGLVLGIIGAVSLVGVIVIAISIAN